MAAKAEITNRVDLKGSRTSLMDSVSPTLNILKTTNAKAEIRVASSSEFDTAISLAFSQSN